MRFVSNKLEHLVLAAELICNKFDLPEVKIKLVPNKIPIPVYDSCVVKGHFKWLPTRIARAAGTYCDGDIKLWTGTDCESTLLHELAHHLHVIKMPGGHSHGTTFKLCLFRIINVWKNHNIRAHWVKLCKASSN